MKTMHGTTCEIMPLSDTALEDPAGWACSRDSRPEMFT